MAILSKLMGASMALSANAIIIQKHERDSETALFHDLQQQRVQKLKQGLQQGKQQGMKLKQKIKSHQRIASRGQQGPKEAKAWAPYTPEKNTAEEKKPPPPATQAPPAVEKDKGGNWAPYTPDSNPPPTKPAPPPPAPAKKSNNWAPMTNTAPKKSDKEDKSDDQEDKSEDDDVGDDDDDYFDMTLSDDMEQDVDQDMNLMHDQCDGMILLREARTRMCT
jgi:hypothetical protein